MFAGVLEINRDAMAIDRLHLPDTPFGTLGMSDEITRREPPTTAFFIGIQWLRCLPIFMYLCMVGAKGRCEKHCRTVEAHRHGISGGK